MRTEIDKVVGVTFDGCQKNIAEMKRGDKILLIREPENQWDRNAIRVERGDGKKLGDVKAGDIGGFVEGYHNLSSQEGDCWIYGNACVGENAQVYGDAMVYEYATIKDSAVVSQNANVFASAKV